MSATAEKEFDFMPLLEGCRCTIDKVVLLVHCPRLILAESQILEEGYETAKEDKLNKLRAFKDRFKQLFKDQLSDFFSPTGTKLYYYWFRFNNGLDFQFGSKNAIRTKKEEDYLDVSKSGRVTINDDNDDESEEWDYIDSEYPIRLEWNPNTVDVSELKMFFQSLGRLSSIEFSKLVKVSRIDIAIDYPFPIYPAFVTCKRKEKTFMVSGRSGMQSIYWGSIQSENQIILYDKKEQLQKKMNTIYQGEHLMRLELRHRDTFFLPDMLNTYNVVKSSGRVEATTKLEDIFKQLNLLTFFRDGCKTNDAEINTIFKAAMHEGLQTTLSEYDKRKRKRLIEKIELLKKLPISHPVEVYYSQFYKVWEDFYSQMNELFRPKEPLPVPADKSHLWAYVMPTLMIDDTESEEDLQIPDMLSPAFTHESQIEELCVCGTPRNEEHNINRHNPLKNYHKCIQCGYVKPRSIEELLEDTNSLPLSASLDPSRYKGQGISK